MGFDPSSGRLLSVSWDGTARTWTLGLRRGVRGMVGQGKYSSLCASASGRHVAVFSNPDGLSLFDDSGRRANRSAFETEDLNFATFTGNGAEVAASVFGRQTFGVWNGEAGTSVERIRAPFDLRWTPPQQLADGRWLLHSIGGALFTWSPGEDPQELYPPDKQAVLGAWVAPGGDRIAATYYALGIRVFALDGSEVWSTGPIQTVERVCFSRDGRSLLAGSSDGNAYLWSLERPMAEKQVFEGHQNSVKSVAFSTDETRIATGSLDGSVRVWDRTTKQTTLQIDTEAWQVAFTRNSQLVTAGGDGTVRWWWISAKPLRDAVEALDVPDLTSDERNRVAHLLR